VVYLRASTAELVMERLMAVRRLSCLVLGV
jgi:hypothetical protein